MHKANKSKRGFTLVELILVVAIIVVLASVLTISISTFLRKSENASNKVDEGVDSLRTGLSASESSLADRGF